MFIINYILVFDKINSNPKKPKKFINTIEYNLRAVALIQNDAKNQDIFFLPLRNKISFLGFQSIV